MVGFYIGEEGHRRSGGEETPLELTQILQSSGVYEDVGFYCYSALFYCD